jgi:hypothetical protein
VQRRWAFCNSLYDPIHKKKEADSMPMRTLNLISAGILIAFACFIVNEANQMPVEYGALGPGFFPRLAGGCLGAFALSILVMTLLSPKDSGDKVTLPRPALLCILAATAVYLFLLPRLGYLVSTPGYLVVTGLLISGQPQKYWKGATLNGILCSAVLYGLFANLLNVPLP